MSLAFKFHPVRVTEADTSLTYALKRWGIYEIVREKFPEAFHASSTEKEQPINGFTFNPNYKELNDGDLICVWNNVLYCGQQCNAEISEGGRVLAHTLQRNKFFAVVEDAERGHVTYLDITGTPPNLKYDIVTEAIARWYYKVKNLAPFGTKGDIQACDIVTQATSFT